MVCRFAVAIGAGKIEFADLTVSQHLAALDCGFRLSAGGVDMDRRSIGEIVQKDRHDTVLVGLHQPVGSGRGLGMAGDEFLHAPYLVEPRLPFWNRCCTALARY